ncbi:MAG: acetyl-CoA carboxylase biotin carboxyl carrier protein [Candidatus Rokuibacteriota bacterium]|jgi:acetyl-CoA carboxylase biotin carboxyl carrier protein|nr:MAG: acetyl-CoA carboxylase biotin carboxyl carrier protein [Candidatus Rokubacteria bacterium]
MPIRRRQRAQSDGAVVELARRLGALLSELGLSEIEAAVGEIRVRLQRGGGSAPAPAPAPAFASGERPAAPIPAEAESTSMVTIEAPMVGTFYRASSPTAEPYVGEGDLVKEGQILCIIEAMKLMNEIESKVGGRIVKIFVENAHPVEFGQSLFLIDPAR